MTNLLILTMLASTTAISTLIRIGCDGGIDVGEKALGGPISARFNGFSKIVDFLDDYIEEAAKDPTCGCPELSGDQLNMFFKTYSPKFLFNLVKGFEGQQLGPLASCGNLKSADTSFVKINLPSSCTAERWNAGQGCQAALTRTEGDLKLVLRMEKCASHEFPFVELKCEGKDCDTILTPCTADSECSDATNFSCLEFASAADQCAQQSCAHAYSSFEVKADTGKCVAGAYNPDSPAGNCVLLGERYGPGFSYAYDADDKDRTKTPKRVSDISNCVMVMCNGSQWTDPMQNVPPSVCFTALTMRKPATGAQCSNAGEIVRNERWPFTSDNTCRWHEIDDAKEYELSHKVKPFAVGSSRYVSNSDDLLGQFFGYDAVDYIANPFGCRKSSDAVRSLVQLARKITDRHAGRAERTLSNSNAVGVCMPGQGYTLKAVESSSGFTRYDINALMGEPTEVLDSLFGVKCDLSCANSERFYSTGSATCTTQETADSTACLLCLNNTVAGNINAQCTCMTSALQCLAQKSSRWCESVFQSTEQLKQARDILSCSRPSSSSNCTVTCGKNAFVYSGAAYGDAQKFDGASARKVRSVNPITAGATVLAHADCSMSIALLPNHPVLGVELSVSGALEFLFGFRNEHRDAYKCRGPVHGGAALTDDQYDVRAFTFNNPLYFMTSPVSTQLTNLGVKFKDFGLQEAADRTGRLAIPKSCTFDNWLEQGQCRLTFTGLGNAELLGEQTELNAYLSVCPGSFLPEAYVECVGKGCKAFGGPTGCAADSDCGLAGLRCHTIDELRSVDSSNRANSFERGDSTQPTTIGMEYVRYYAQIEKEAPNAGAFVFTKPIDISEATLIVVIDLPKGVTEGAEVLVIKGPYVGKFKKVDYSANQYVDVSNPTCDIDSIVGTTTYKSDGIYVSTKCTCSLNGKRSVVMPKNLELGTAFKNALSKRQARSSDNAIAFLDGTSGVFRKDKEECLNKYQTSLLPKFLALVSGKEFNPSHTGLCLADLKSRDAQGRFAAEVWANDQVQIDGSIITLKYLKSWKEDSSLQPIDDGKSLHDKFGKDAEWFEKTGRFCVDCKEGVNKDVGQTGAAATLVTSSAAAAVVATMAFVLFM